MLPGSVDHQTKQQFCLLYGNMNIGNNESDSRNDSKKNNEIALLIADSQIMILFLIINSINKLVKHS